MAMHPSRVPIICDSVQHSNLPAFQKKKFLAPKTMTCAEFTYIVRKHLDDQKDQKSSSPTETLYMLFEDGDNKYVSSRGHMFLDEAYNKHASPDGYLKAWFTNENTLGYLLLPSPSSPLSCRIT